MVDQQRLPTLASIHAFEAAARLQSFATAGRELGTSAASVSYHVKQVETQIGATLFRRFPHRVELTEAGRLVARETTDAFSTLRASFVRATDLDNSHLALTTLPTFGASWLAPRLGVFRNQHPEVQINLELSGEARDLACGLFDAAVRNGHGVWPGLRTAKLFPSIFLPLCAPELQSAASKELCDRSKPRTIPLLGRPDLWRLWCRAMRVDLGLDDHGFGLNLAEEHLDAAAAVAGSGITIGSPILLAAEIQAGRLVAAHPQAASDGRAFWFAFPVGRQQSRKIETFKEWLTQQAAGAIADAHPFLCNLITLPTRPDVSERSLLI